MVEKTIDTNHNSNKISSSENNIINFESPVLEAKNLNVHYGKVLAVKNVSIQVPKNNVVSLINFTGIIAPNMGRKKGLNIQDYNKLIEQAFQNKRNKAVVLVINSPGGSPVQSEFLADRLSLIHI